MTAELTVVYTDGTTDWVRSSPSRSIRGGMDRYYTDVLHVSATKDIERVDLRIVTPSALAATFFTDNADIVGI